MRFNFLKTTILVFLSYILNHSFAQENHTWGIGGDFYHSSIGRPGITTYIWIKRQHFTFGGGPRIVLPFFQEQQVYFDAFCRRDIISNNTKFKSTFSLALELHGTNSEYSFQYDTSPGPTPAPPLILPTESGTVINVSKNKVTLSANALYGFRWNIIGPFALNLNAGVGLKSSGQTSRYYEEPGNLILRRSSFFNSVRNNFLMNCGILIDLRKVPKKEVS